MQRNTGPEQNIQKGLAQTNIQYCNIPKTGYEIISKDVFYFVQPDLSSPTLSHFYLNERKHILNNLHKIVNLKEDATYTTEQKRKEDLKTKLFEYSQ